MSNKVFAGVALVLAGGAHATTYTGTVQKALSSASTITAGNTRVSIFTGSTTSCGNAGWYAYDMPSASVGSMWGATLLAAITAGAPVTVNGTGTCDQFGLEIVSSISALP